MLTVDASIVIPDAFVEVEQMTAPDVANNDPWEQTMFVDEFEDDVTATPRRIDVVNVIPFRPLLLAVKVLFMTSSDFVNERPTALALLLFDDVRRPLNQAFDAMSVIPLPVVHDEVFDVPVEEHSINDSVAMILTKELNVAVRMPAHRRVDNVIMMPELDVDALAVMVLVVSIMLLLAIKMPVPVFVLVITPALIVDCMRLIPLPEFVLVVIVPAVINSELVRNSPMAALDAVRSPTSWTFEATSVMPFPTVEVETDEAEADEQSIVDSVAVTFTN